MIRMSLVLQIAYKEVLTESAIFSNGDNRQCSRRRARQPERLNTRADSAEASATLKRTHWPLVVYVLPVRSRKYFPSFPSSSTISSDIAYNEIASRNVRQRRRWRRAPCRRRTLAAKGNRLQDDRRCVPLHQRALDCRS